MIFHVVLVGVGGFFGAICRYLISQRWNRSLPSFPYGTLTVNLVGAFLLGWIAGGQFSETWTLLFGTGFLGAFTTFSTLKWESVQLWQNKEWRKLFLYVGVSYTAGILFAIAGYFLGSTVWKL